MELNLQGNAYAPRREMSQEDYSSGLWNKAGVLTDIDECRYLTVAGEHQIPTAFPFYFQWLISIGTFKPIYRESGECDFCQHLVYFEVHFLSEYKLMGV